VSFGRPLAVKSSGACARDGQPYLPRWSETRQERRTWPSAAPVAKLSHARGRRRACSLGSPRSVVWSARRRLGGGRRARSLEHRSRPAQGPGHPGPFFLEAAVSSLPGEARLVSSSTRPPPKQDPDGTRPGLTPESAASPGSRPGEHSLHIDAPGRGRLPPLDPGSSRWCQRHGRCDGERARSSWPRRCKGAPRWRRPRLR